MKRNSNRYNMIWRNLTLMIMVIMVSVSCTKDFDEYNTDKTQMMAVGQKELDGLFSKAETEGMGWQMAVLAAKFYCIMPMHLCGYTVTGYQSQELNVLTKASNINETYRRAYINVYNHLQVIMNVAKRDNLNAEYGIALVFKVQVFHRQTDIFGPIPYSEMGQPKESIKFDSQRDVYYQMFDELREAAGLLETELKKNPAANAFGINDMIYNGSVEKWLRFCNTLRLRLAMRISNIDPTKAKMEAEAAVKGIMLETNADDGLFQTKDLTGSSGYGHGMPQMYQYLTDFMSTSMESYMVGYKDPRISEYWSPVGTPVSQTTDPNFTGNIGGYHGATSGASLEWMTSAILRAHSLTGPRFADGNQRKTPINVINAAETWFLKAEGAWKGWNMGTGDAQTFYDKGIEVSIKQWRPTINATLITEYINSTNTPVAPKNYPYNDAPVTDTPVKFSSDKNQQYEQIMIQKWLANYPNAVEAYSELRRTRLPKLYAKKTSLNANVNPDQGQMIVRYPFPDMEKTTQPLEVERATEMLGGNPDLESTPVWWDTNNNGSVTPGKY